MFLLHVLYILKNFYLGHLKSYVDRLFNVVQWNEYPSGGHFAALEEPDTLVKDIRNFFKVIK